VSIAQVVRDKGQMPQLTVCAFRACAAADRRKTLQELVKQHALAGANCVSVLEPGSYQLLQVEAPDVDATELKAAVRWRVKELIDFHIDDAAIDVFEMPSQGSRARARIMYVVAARNPLIMQRVELLQGAGLNVHTIDITELALRNIAQLLPEDEGGTALLQLSAGEGMITLTRQATLYLARNLDIGALQLGAGGGAGFSADNLALAPQSNRERAFETIMLEVQRSFDYYESNFGQSPIKNLIIGPLAEPQDELAEYAASHLGVKARALDLNTIVKSRTPLDSSLQASCVSTIGAALRLEEKTL
jgi:MSHA biogenesis protein MshI